MTRKIWFAFPLMLPCILLCSTVARASTVNAASCSSSDVQAAINSASAGDTVNVPSGSCTWTTKVSIANKGITLQGQTTCSGTPASSCVDNTNISANLADNALEVTGASATNFVTITGFSFTATQGYGHGTVQVDSGTMFDVAFRIHHMHFIAPGSGGGGTIVAITNSYGLIDHVLFDETGSDTYHMIDFFGDWISGGFQSWNQATAFGTNQAVYVEDSTVNNSNQGDDTMDGYAGARIVVRHNQINNASIGFHGTDSGSYRSIFSVEECDNTFTNNSPTKLRMLTLRGGTALSWGNTFGGSFGSWYAITAQIFRADGSGNVSTWQNCNGTNWLLESIDPTTTAGRTNATSPTGTVSWCAINRDTTCTANSTCSSITVGDTCSTFFDNSGGGTGGPGYGCRDQPGRTHNQVQAPVYEWLNTGGAGIDGSDAPSYLVANQDYYQYTSSFTGAAGTGSGLLSARPATCAAAVAYWATDTSTLYQCSSANTWTIYYQPYTYPDPLQTENGQQPPGPPTGLNAQVD